MNLGLLAFHLKRSCGTTGKLRDSNSSFKAVSASISLSHFKSFISWSSIKQSICVFFNDFIALTLTISFFIRGSGFKSSLMSLFMGFGKVCKRFSEESLVYFHEEITNPLFCCLKTR